MTGATRVLGLMSGTSHDGIDGVVVDFTAEDGGVGLHASVLTHVSTPYEPALRARLVAALPPAPADLAEVTALDTLIGQAFGELAERAVSEAGPVDLVASHGQTVFHWIEPDAAGTPQARGTLQLGQPAWIAEAAGAPVLADVRARDIAAGGQGAPLVGLLDALLLAERARAGVRPAALNLGGIANVSVIEPGGGAAATQVRAWDTGPANALMDAVVHDRGAHPEGYDADGALAAAGVVDETLLEELLAEPYYRQAPPKSTGKELFHLGHLRAAMAAAGATDLSTEDLLATLAALTVRTVAADLRDAGAGELYVSGGGAKNPVVMAGLAGSLPGVQVRTSDELGVGAQEKEALLMAVLGWYAWHGLAANLPAATGAHGPRLLGSLTPGPGALRLPEPRFDPPAWLRMQ